MKPYFGKINKIPITILNEIKKMIENATKFVM